MIKRLFTGENVIRNVACGTNVPVFLRAPVIATRHFRTAYRTLDWRARDISTPRQSNRDTQLTTGEYIRVC